MRSAVWNVAATLFGVALVAPSVAQDSASVLRQVEQKVAAFKTGEARELLGPVSDTAATDATVALATGLVLDQEQKYDEAARHLKKATELAPTDPTAQVLLGETYLRMKKSSEASAAYSKAVQLADAAVKKDPTDAAGWLALGMARQRLKKYDDAAKALEKAIALRPDDAAPRYQLGVTRAFEGKWSEAADALTAAVEKDSGYAYAYYYRALAYDKLKRKDKLVNDMERFLSIAPGSPEAVRAKAILDAAKR